MDVRSLLGLRPKDETAAGLRRSLAEAQQAGAAAAEATGEAAANLARFAADRGAARAGGEAFLLERYFAALAAALPKAPLTVVDSRIPAPDAPILDLRPPSATSAPGAAGRGME